MRTLDPVFRTSILTRQGLSLVEVLAALIVIAGAVTTTFSAHVRGIESVRRATLALEAQAVAHELKTEWELNTVPLCASAQGEFENPGGHWRWRRDCRRVLVLDPVHAYEVTLELVVTSDDMAHRPWRRAFTWLVPSEE